jgi:hypothetical protein
LLAKTKNVGNRDKPGHDDGESCDHFIVIAKMKSAHANTVPHSVLAGLVSAIHVLVISHEERG